MTKELTKRVITSLVLATIVLNCLLINNHSWLKLHFKFLNRSEKKSIGYEVK